MVRPARRLGHSRRRVAEGYCLLVRTENPQICCGCESEATKIKTRRESQSLHTARANGTMRQGEARINSPLSILAYKRHYLHVSGEQGGKMKTLMAKPGYPKLRSKMMSILYMLVAGVNQAQNRRHIPQPARKEEQTKSVHNSRQALQLSSGQCASILLLLFAEQIRPIIAAEPRLENLP
jgi:hypothetical protein